MKKWIRFLSLALILMMAVTPAWAEEEPTVPSEEDTSLAEENSDYTDRDILFVQQDGDVDVDLLLSCMDSEYVESFSLFGMDGARSDTLRPIGYEEKAGKYMQPSVKNPDEEVEAPYFTLYCQSDLDELSFSELAGDVVEGALIDPQGSGQCMISRALAEKNNKKVGDTISLYNYQDPEKKLDLVISGIYESVFALSAEEEAAMEPVEETTEASAEQPAEEDVEAATDETVEGTEGAVDDGAALNGEEMLFETAISDNSNNDIFVQLTDMLAFTEDNGVEYTWNLSSCILNDAANMDAFVQECRDKGLPESIEISRMTDLFEEESDADVPAEAMEPTEDQAAE